MDFLSEHEISDLLTELGITATPEGNECILLQMDEDKATAKHCLDNADCMPCGSDDETSCFELAPGALVIAAISAVHKIHKGSTVLIPVSKWRAVFDAVAFSMAGDESWQEFDASATIKLNTRDPLLFETGDQHTLVSLLTSLMNDGETREQGVFLMPVGAPILVHLQPGGPVKFWFGNSAIADEVREAYTN